MRHHKQLEVHTRSGKPYRWGPAAAIDIVLFCRHMQSGPPLILATVLQHQENRVMLSGCGQQRCIERKYLSLHCILAATLTWLCCEHATKLCCEHTTNPLLAGRSICIVCQQPQLQQCLCCTLKRPTAVKPLHRVHQTPAAAAAALLGL
jgi:hypothetical protein